MSKDTELKAEKKLEGKEIFRWSPPATAQKSVSDDVPEEYVVTEVADACSGGIVIWAKYNGKWRANPWNTRTLVKHLLNHLPADDSEAEIRRLEAENNRLEGMLENMQDDNVAKEAKLAEAEKREAGWISVEDKLPEKGYRCLFLKGGNVYCGNKSHITDKFTTTVNGTMYHSGVTHWMPYPPLPAKEGE